MGGEVGGGGASAGGGSVGEGGGDEMMTGDDAGAVGGTGESYAATSATVKGRGEWAVEPTCRIVT